MSARQLAALLTAFRRRTQPHAILVCLYTIWGYLNVFPCVFAPLPKKGRNLSWVDFLPLLFLNTKVSAYFFPDQISLTISSSFSVLYVACTKAVFRTTWFVFRSLAFIVKNHLAVFGSTKVSPWTEKSLSKRLGSHLKH